MKMQHYLPLSRWSFSMNNVQTQLLVDGPDIWARVAGFFFSLMCLQLSDSLNAWFKVSSVHRLLVTWSCRRRQWLGCFYPGIACTLQIQNQQCQRRARAEALRVWWSRATPTAGQNKSQVMLDFKKEVSRESDSISWQEWLCLLTETCELKSCSWHKTARQYRGSLGNSTKMEGK